MKPRIYDLSLPQRPDQPPWPKDPLFSCRLISSIREGDACNVSQIVMSSHYATHLDAPFHFEDDGITVDQLALETLIGPALVHETSAAKLIQPQDLPDLSGVERILFKTRNSDFITDRVFHTDFVSIGLQAATVLVQAGVRLVGIDYFSVEAFTAPGHPVHHVFCRQGVILVEGLNLQDVSPGWYDLTVLPLKIQGGDGSPCRAVLREIKIP